MVNVNVEAFEAEVRGRTGNLLPADVHLPPPAGEGPHLIVLGALMLSGWRV